MGRKLGENKEKEGSECNTHVRRVDFKIKQEKSRNGQTLMNDSFT